ncbi:MAG: haloacid dehalogenase-like hydrolase [Dehalococcoidia bacterium]|nr:haloacid dehalogenase-like hydrolase [Dehalococcoidia bacterium]
MAFEVLISDWNGTLVQYRTELPALERVGVDAFRASIPFHPLRALRILKARSRLRAIQRQGRPVTDPDSIKDMFSVFNHMVVSGLPTSVAQAAFDSYAMSAETQSRLDLRLLRIIRECHEAGKTTGILSAGYRYGIEMVLAVAGYRHCFDFCEADEFKTENGRVMEFGLNIYRNKPRLLIRLLTERQLETGQVAYIGDSEDDEGCFEIVGYPIVAFLAPDDFKNKCSRRYGAFVPGSEDSLREYLLHA